MEIVYRLGRTPVFIYQMGKVGSSSIYYSLRFKYRGLVVHGHSFKSTSQTYEISKLYKHFRKGKRLKIITLIREPFGRNVSAFFQNFERFTGGTTEEWNGEMSDLIKIFVDKYPHSLPLEWFNEKIRDVFQIDFLANPFPENGYQVLGNKGVEILLMKHDLDDSSKEVVISKFLNIPSFKMKRHNESSSKVYNELYDQFKTKFKYPKPIFIQLLNSKYVNHFYNDSRDKLESQWCDSN